MRARDLYLGFAIILAGCVRHHELPPAPVKDDRSIVFPRFDEQPTVQVGGRGVPYELDGVVLRALLIAANHFSPSSDQTELPCWARQQAQRYRIIRQGDVIFVDISEDPEACGQEYISLDSGVTYAISADGQILRRLAGAHPERVLGSSSSSAGSQAVPVPPVSSPPPAPSTVGDGGLPPGP
jgi:hypothetical protein